VVLVCWSSLCGIVDILGVFMGIYGYLWVFGFFRVFKVKLVFISYKLQKIWGDFIKGGLVLESHYIVISNNTLIRV